MPDALLHRPAVDIARLIASREVSPVEIFEAVVARLGQVNVDLNALVTLDLERAADRAREAEQLVGTRGAPPFLGVPIAIKDLHETAGLRTTYGTRTLADHVPVTDGVDVARIRDAGFNIIGKTNTCELGTEPITESALLGPCRNPWDTTRSSGGSSGGAAAAVAAGLLPVAHGSDSGGSLRIPTASCGVIGLKPARGRISNAPRWGDWVAGLGTTGPIGRYVRDVAALLDVMRGPASGDPHWASDPARPYVEEAAAPPGHLRIGLVLTSPVATVDPQILAATQQAAGLLTDLGHTVELVDLPVTRDLIHHFATVWTSTVAAQPIAPEYMDDFNAGLAEMGAKNTAADLLRAITAMQRASREIIAAAAAFDAVLSPTLAQFPPLIGAWADLGTRERFAAGGQFSGFTPIANITGQPAISLPQGRSREGLPIGVMLTGRPADEATLLRLAAQMEESVKWVTWRPPEPPSA